eukprot:TRINITY_DN3131_c0_g1_i1.p1 TRINITY_DN3131_c0_g1~~TRINITY_DN3131_c0_g1_i1.p1  ORF type:complete len:407 (+),score=120.71 TRINITY_DN3131_c0_g1_i1:62-1282(+)
MAASKGTNTYNRQNWEDSDFPILCQTCLGDNPYIRMTKEKFGKECKICTRPFTIFRWCPGAKMRFKKTEVCQTCAKMKNVCQTCMLDLEYGLPVQVRDHALKIAESLPTSAVNREYFLQNQDAELAKRDDHGPGGALGKISSQKHELLTKLARTTPYYKRNRPHICSFWVKGECKRGEECPYRHEKPTDPDDPLADQNIKDRYYGVNDPVAEKLLNRAKNMPSIEPPEDKSITTLFVGGLDDGVAEQDVKNAFYSFGEIRNIHMVPKQGVAYVTFTKRSDAETAAEKCFNKLVIRGCKTALRWGKNQGKASISAPPTTNAAAAAADADDMGTMSLPSSLPPPPMEGGSRNYFGLTGGPPGGPGGRGGMPPRPPPMGIMGLPPSLPPAGSIPYPSQDPSRMGAAQRY